MERVKNSLRNDNDEREDNFGQSYYYETHYNQPFLFRRRQGRFSRTELEHLLIASGMIVILSISMIYPDFPIISLIGFDFESVFLLTVILLLTFIPHELMHKVLAQKYGLFAEFRIIPSYALLTLIILFVPGSFIKIFAPGAVMIAGEATLQAYGKTSAAGPATNLVIGGAMLGLGFALPDLASFFWVGTYFCGWIALFNMLPIAPLDGEKVLHWSITGFAALLVGSVLLFIVGLLLLPS
jgi:Zn-dependent protease